VPLAAYGVVLKAETSKGSPLAHPGPVADEESLAISDGGLGRGVIGGRGGIGVRRGGSALLLGLDGRHRLVGSVGAVLEGHLGGLLLDFAALARAILRLLVLVGRGGERAVGIDSRQVQLMALASVDDGLELEGGQLALLDDVGGHGEVVCATYAIFG